MKLTNKLRQFFAPLKHWGLIEYTECLAGLLFFMYLPIVIGIIWGYNFTLLLKLAGTNTLLVAYTMLSIETLKEKSDEKR